MNGHTMLVVDDQLGIVSFLYDFFTCRGYTVFQATSGRKAIQVFKSEQPQIVLLDIKLGWGRDGINVLEEIKNISSNTRVIMMTSVTDKDVVDKAFSLGADDYITKPLSLTYLEKVVLLKIVNIDIERLGEKISINGSEESI